MATTNLANSVALLQPPFREDQTARAEEITAQPQQEPMADIFIAIDHAAPEEDILWYPTGNEHTITAGDTKMVENIPQLVDHTEGDLSGVQPATPSAYDWRTDTGRGYSAAPYGRPRHGDTYTWDGDTYHTVGVRLSCSP